MVRQPSPPSRRTAIVGAAVVPLATRSAPLAALCRSALQSAGGSRRITDWG